MDILPLHLIIGGLSVTVVLQAIVIRYLAVDPGFKILTRAAGELTLWLAFPFRHVIIAYGDIDSLGMVNAALTDETTLGHDALNTMMRWAMAHMRDADRALIYGGDEMRLMTARFDISRWRRVDAAAFCARFQDVMRAYAWTDAQRAALIRATGKDHVTITLAHTEANYTGRGAALARCKVAVGAMKPKDAPGQRGAIVRAA